MTRDKFAKGLFEKVWAAFAVDQQCTECNYASLHYSDVQTNLIPDFSPAQKPRPSPSRPPRPPSPSPAFQQQAQQRATPRPSPADEVSCLKQ